MFLPWLLIGAIGAGVGWRHASSQRDALLERMKTGAIRCAVALDVPDLDQLTGTTADLKKDAYFAVKRRLLALRNADPAVRFVYMFRRTEVEGKVVFVADSEPAGLPDESKAGDDYPEASISPNLQAILRDGIPTTQPPVKDSFGEWITAYAVVRKDSNGRPLIVLGLDLNAITWRREFLRDGIFAACYVCVLLGLPFGIWQVLRRERKLNRNIGRLSMAIQQSHSSILITDQERRIEYANDGCLARTGYALKEVIGQPLRIFVPEDFDEMRRLSILNQVLAGERWQGEIAVRHRNGSVFPARATLSPVGGKEMSGLVIIFDDITDLKKNETALRQARDQAESADRAKGEFLAVMSHELRTPLNGIIGFASLLEDTPVNAEQRDYAQTIRRSGEALLDLTNELLDYSRIDAGRLQLDLQPCSPRQVVEEAMELLSTRAAEKNLELITSIDASVPATVIADPGRLRQVLMNLIGNAIKFTPSGEVEVVVAASDLPVDGQDQMVRLDFTVRDTGIGIAPDQQQRLFTPFMQLDASSTRKHGGTGLGLAISRRLVRLMQGEIEVTSATGQGSTFHFKVVAQLVERGLPLSPLTPRTMTLLSANPSARRHYTALLESWGLNVDAHTSLETINASAHPHGIIVDIPARDAALWPGIIRKHVALSQSPLIGLLPVSVPALTRDELRPSFRALLKKPLREPLLHAVLASLAKQ